MERPVIRDANGVPLVLGDPVVGEPEDGRVTDFVYIGALEWRVVVSFPGRDPERFPTTATTSDSWESDLKCAGLERTRAPGKSAARR